PSPVRAVLDDVDVAIPADVIDIEPPAASVVGSEREREQSRELLAENQGPEVEEGLREQPGAGDDADESALLDDVKPLWLASGCSDVVRSPKPVDNRRELQPRRPPLRRRRARGGGDECRHDERDDPAGNDVAPAVSNRGSSEERR